MTARFLLFFPKNQNMDTEYMDTIEDAQEYVEAREAEMDGPAFYCLLDLCTMKVQSYKIERIIEHHELAENARIYL